MDNPLFFPIDLRIAAAYALLMLGLVLVYRRARSTIGRLIIYLVCVMLVLFFLFVFAPR